MRKFVTNLSLSLSLSLFISLPLPLYLSLSLSISFLSLWYDDITSDIKVNIYLAVSRSYPYSSLVVKPYTCIYTVRRIVTNVYTIHYTPYTVHVFYIQFIDSRK